MIVWIAFALYLKLALCTNNYVKGVKASNQHLYINLTDEFTCLDKSKIIPYSYVNDDYCDCNDGTDEPGTTACPNGEFWCRNQGYHETKILSRYVNDGNCNCCDGSDEMHVHCENTCLKLAELERMENLRQYNIIKNGKLKAQEFTISFDKLKSGISAKIPVLSEKIITLKESLMSFNESIGEFNYSLEQMKKAVMPALILSTKEFQADQYFYIIDENHNDIITAKEIEESHIIQFYKFDSLSLAIKSSSELDREAFKNLWMLHNQTEMLEEDYIDSSYYTPPSVYDHTDSDEDLSDQEIPEEEKEYGEDGMEISKNKKRTPSMHAYSLYRKKRNLFMNIERDIKLKIENPENEDIQNTMVKLEKIQSDYDVMEKDYMNTCSEYRLYNNFFSQDFGPEKAYGMLYEYCYSRPIENFNYTICPFQYGIQTSTTSGESFNMGKFKSWSKEEPLYVEMIYEEGDTCSDNTKRSFKLIFSCGDQNHIESISEVSYCHYTVHFKTPAACVLVPLPHIHDDL